MIQDGFRKRKMSSSAVMNEGAKVSRMASLPSRSSSAAELVLETEFTVLKSLIPGVAGKEDISEVSSYSYVT